MKGFPYSLNFVHYFRLLNHKRVSLSLGVFDSLFYFLLVNLFFRNLFIQRLQMIFQSVVWIRSLVKLFRKLWVLSHEIISNLRESHVRNKLFLLTLFISLKFNIIFSSRFDFFASTSFKYFYSLANSLFQRIFTSFACDLRLILRRLLYFQDLFVCLFFR